MPPPDIVARLRLIRSDNIGPVTYAQLLARFGSAQAALDAIPDLARRGGGRPAKLASAAEVEREIDSVARLGARYLFRGDEALSGLARRDRSAPPALIVKRRARRCSASRWWRWSARATPRPPPAASRASSRAALGEAGAVIVSGLARGIDTAAHDGAFETGTVAVIAGGIDIFYPPENEERQRAIAERGVLVAEQPPGIEPRARHFPYRNRIIAGLAAGTVVIEAAPKSGSLITARYAAEYGREVMAIPGSPLDPRAQGCNQLIREGATLVQSADDVLEAIRPLHLGRARPPAPRQAVAEPPADAGDSRAPHGPRPARPDAGPGRRADPPVRPAAGRRPARPARAGAGRPSRAPCRRQGEPAD